MLLESMQPIDSTGFRQVEALEGQITEAAVALDRPPSLLRRLEIWSGRLAMFSLTTMLVAIAINPR